MLARRKGWALICAAVLLSGAVVATNARVAMAQGAPPAAGSEDPKGEAKKYYTEANEKFKDGDYAGALPLFQQADQAYPGAAPKHKIAVCLDKLGKHREAIDAYRTFIASNPSEKYADRVRDAGARIAELEATLPAEVTVIVSPPDAPEVQIAVNGEPKTGPTLELPAGQHTIVVTAQGYQPLTEVVTVKGAEKRDLALTLVPVEAAPPPPPPPPPPAGGEEDTGGGSNVPAYVTLGIAGAGVILGTIFGIQALGAKSDFDDDPTNENADDAERAALIADMSFGVALTFGITGIVLLFTGGDDGGEEEVEEEAAYLPELMPYGGPKGGGMAATWTF